MKELISLPISNDKKILIKTYNEEPDIFMFDEIVIEYDNKNKRIILFDDFLCEGMRALANILERGLAEELQIDETLREDGIGYQWNIECDNLQNDYWNHYNDKILQYHIWAGVGNHSYDTWLFNDRGKLYMEISPIYNLKRGQKFIYKYEMVFTFELNKKNAKQWLQKCKSILQNMKK